MNFRKTDFEGVRIFSLESRDDHRGCFMETYRSEWFEQQNFIQDNQAISKRRVVRGLHFQSPPFAQTKLIRVIEGEILDVILDLRTYSKTYGKVFSLNLSADNNIMLLVPKGFAHGYSTLSKTSTVIYKVDQYYNKDFDTGIHPLSRDLDINWGVNPILSKKDQNLIDFSDFKSPF